MTDRELLEAAAKAAGIEGEYFEGPTPGHHVGIHQGYGHYWNPLADDGDALRLAVKLMTEHGMETDFAVLRFNHGDKHEDDDPYAATRRSIVRTAAALGETKREG